MNSSEGIVGVLGGMGPLATVDFMRKLLEVTPATSDQEHVPVLVSNIPQIPDRTQAFRGEGRSPVDALITHAKRLRAAGAGLIVMPCNTAHLWFDDIRDGVGLPMLHIADAAIAEALRLTSGPLSLGLLATDATLASGLYVNRTASVSADSPRRWLQPTARETLEWVMPGIEAVKAGDLGAGQTLLLRAAHALTHRGANALVLGCTEIPLVIDASHAPAPLVDATHALAQRAVEWSLAQRSGIHGQPVAPSPVEPPG